MAQFRLEDYEPVQDRIGKFYLKYPDGRIITHMHGFSDDGNIIFKATLYKSAEEMSNDTILSTGWAHEKVDSSFVNKTSALENCETSAIGRALANIGLHGDKRPSKEEMQKVQNNQEKQIINPIDEKLKTIPNYVAEYFRANKFTKAEVVQFCDEYQWNFENINIAITQQEDNPA